MDDTSETFDDRASPEPADQEEEAAMPEQLPEWERLLRAAARLQGILPEATLVGGTAAAIDAGHRRSMDADHVIAGLSARFDDVLAELEAAAGCRTARVKRPVAIYGSLDRILTTVRNQIRTARLETIEVTTNGQKVRIPTRAEILRVKAWLIVRRNATRDYLDGMPKGRHADGIGGGDAAHWVERPQEVGCSHASPAPDPPSTHARCPR